MSPHATQTHPTLLPFCLTRASRGLQLGAIAKPSFTSSSRTFSSLWTPCMGSNCTMSKGSSGSQLQHCPWCYLAYFSSSVARLLSGQPSRVSRSVSNFARPPFVLSNTCKTDAQSVPWRVCVVACLSLETAKRLDRAVSEAQQHVMSGHKRSKKKDMSAASDLVSKAAAFAGRFSWPRALC